MYMGPFIKDVIYRGGRAGGGGLLKEDLTFKLINDVFYEKPLLTLVKARVSDLMLLVKDKFSHIF